MEEVSRLLQPDEDVDAAPAVTPGAPSLAPLRTREELLDFARQKFGVTVPDTKCCAGHAPPADAFAASYFADKSMTIWKASRGLGGKSHLLSLLASVEAATLHCDVTLLGGSGEQSERILESTTGFWEFPHAPADELAGEPTQKVIRFRRGHKVYRLTASSRSVRGPHPVRMRIDEADEMKWKIYEAASGQTMAKRGVKAQTTAASTHHYPNGTMTRILKMAADRGWPVFEWCYKENLEPHGWLAASEVGRKRDEVTVETFRTEYDLQEPSPENRAIVPECVDKMFTRKLGAFAGGNGEYIELERPHKRGRYATGADWARTSDRTCIWTFRIDVSPMRLVAFEQMNRRPWPEMVKKFDRRVQRYPGPAAHDATGVGDVVDGYISVEATGVKLVGKDRADIFTEYIAGIENGECLAPYIEYTAKEHKHASTDDLFGGGHPPDTFVAGAMAYHAATKVDDPELVVG